MDECVLKVGKGWDATLVDPCADVAQGVAQDVAQGGVQSRIIFPYTISHSEPLILLK